MVKIFRGMTPVEFYPKGKKMQISTACAIMQSYARSGLCARDMRLDFSLARRLVCRRDDCLRSQHTGGINAGGKPGCPRLGIGNE
jgi:hypothetical protein